MTAFALLGLSACGLGATPALGKVIVDQFTTDVIFGAGQPSPTPSAPQQPIGLGLAQPLPSLFLGNNFSLPSFQGEAACASAPPTGAPAQEATSDVSGRPVVGQYRWLGAGMAQETVLTTTVHLPVASYLNVDVRRVQTSTDQQDQLPALPGSTPSDNFYYETVMPWPTGGFYDFHWKVKTNAQSGDPEGGLSLSEIDLLDGSGSVVKQLFKGEPALLLLPLPATPGTVGVSGPNGGVGPTVSADTSGNSNNLEFDGTVGGRERIDACGTWIQAWPVDGTLQNGSSNMATLHMDVSTQFGALVVALNIDGNFLGTVFTKMATHTGQVQPDPLPKGFQ